MPIHVDNATVVGFVNNTIKRQRSRAMEMRCFWLLDQAIQAQFDFECAPGAENLADCMTKFFNGPAHQRVRPFHTHQADSPRFLPRAARRGQANDEGVLEVAPGIPAHIGIPCQTCPLY